MNGGANVHLAESVLFLFTLFCNFKIDRTQNKKKFFFILSLFFFQKFGQTPLGVASLGGNPQIVEMLLNRGANANSQRKVELLNYFDIFCYDIFVMIFFFLKDGATPLFFAAQKGYEQIVQILLEKGGANVHLAESVLFLFSLFCNFKIDRTQNKKNSFSFFPSFSFRNLDKLHLVLLLLMEIHKLLKCY